MNEIIEIEDLQSVLKSHKVSLASKTTNEGNRITMYGDLSGRLIIYKNNLPEYKNINKKLMVARYNKLT